MNKILKPSCRYLEIKNIRTRKKMNKILKFIYESLIKIRILL